MSADDDLYGLPLDRFVAERNALAKKLRAEGDREAASEVGKLPKPSVAAWAVNTAVRSDPDAAEELAASARMLREAQEELLSGGDASALREASERARRAVDALLAAAPAGGDATREKVRSTLHAATTDPEVLEEVVAGRVIREREASGFGGLGTVATPRKPAPKKKDDTKAREADRRRQEKLRKAKEEEAAAEQAVTAARRALEQIESALADRQAALREGEDRLKDARRRRERAER